MITEEELIDMMVEYLCEDNSERELREIVERSIRLSNGEPVMVNNGVFKAETTKNL